MNSDENSASRSFPKKERLIKTGGFRNVYKSGSSFTGGPLVLKTLPNALTFNRIGFSISSRNIKKAVRRNRIRRLLREAFRKNKEVLKKGFDIVLIARKDEGKDFSYKVAENIFLKLAGKAGILI